METKWNQHKLSAYCSICVFCKVFLLHEILVGATLQWNLFQSSTQILHNSKGCSILVKVAEI